MKNYFITGAAQGLGRELTIALAKNNNNLILLDKDISTLNQFYDDLTENFHCEITLLPMDLLGSTIDHYQEIKEKLTNQFKQLDGVFLNAAFLPACTPIEHFEFENWYTSLQINLNANFHLIQSTLALLKQSDCGKLVVILDENIKDKPAYYGAYGVAKAGLEQLLKSLAKENEKPSCYLANLPAFQSNTRSKQFPSENPNDLPTAENIAQQLITELEYKPSTLIERL